MENSYRLGELELVELRTFWRNEALDFTSWLSREGNLSKLSDEIGIEIKLIQTEAHTGKYNTDILAKDGNDNNVIIENQLESSDHDHLGKIITYAAGHDAKTIVWIVKEVEDEHKKAIEWLNDHTDDNINFFIIKMELWKIGDSLPAPKFHIVSQPNEWAKEIRKLPQASEPTETKLMQLEFWQKFIEFANNNRTTLRLRKPRPQQWYDISVGSSNAHISLTINTQQKLLGCDLYIPEDKALFAELTKYREQIEKAVGDKLDWKELPEKKASRIKMSRTADIADSAQWDAYFAWLKEKAELFQKAFQGYLKAAKSM